MNCCIRIIYPMMLCDTCWKNVWPYIPISSSLTGASGVTAFRISPVHSRSLLLPSAFHRYLKLTRDSFDPVAARSPAPCIPNDLDLAQENLKLSESVKFRLLGNLPLLAVALDAGIQNAPSPAESYAHNVRIWLILVLVHVYALYLLFKLCWLGLSELLRVWTGLCVCFWSWNLWTSVRSAQCWNIPRFHLVWKNVTWHFSHFMWKMALYWCILIVISLLPLLWHGSHRSLFVFTSLDVPKWRNHGLISHYPGPKGIIKVISF